MEFKIDTDQFKAVEQAMKENQRVTITALRRTLNKIAMQSNTLIIRETGRSLNLSQKKIREQVSIRRANKNELEASVTAKRQAIPLIEYKARQLKTGVSIRVKKEQSRQKLKHAFTQTMKSGHNGVFEREKGVPRLPIHELYGPAVIEIAQDYFDGASKLAQNKFLKIFQHEYEFALKST